MIILLKGDDYMPCQHLPGTSIQLDLQGGQDYRLVFDALFAVTGGIYLSQLADIIEEPAPTIQNWVKRGFVSRPEAKRYTRRQTCRMILISLLRHAMPLDDVAHLLSLINHDLADEKDDLIDDSELYFLFCDIVIGLDPKDYFLSKPMLSVIKAKTEGFTAGTKKDH